MASDTDKHPMDQDSTEHPVTSLIDDYHKFTFFLYRPKEHFFIKCRAKVLKFSEFEHRTRLLIVP